MIILDYTIGDGDPLTIKLDASTNEQHQLSSTISSHPVESGAPITDNVDAQPFRLTLECVVTNTPLTPEVLAPSLAPRGVLDANGGLSFPQDLDRVRDVYSALVDAWKGGAIFAVTTSLWTYQSLCIANVSWPRNAQNTNSATFTIDFQEVITADVSVVDTPAAVKAAPNAQRRHRGAKPAQPVASATPAQKSTAAALLDKATGATQ